MILQIDVDAPRLQAVVKEKTGINLKLPAIGNSETKLSLQDREQLISAMKLVASHVPHPMKSSVTVDEFFSIGVAWAASGDAYTFSFEHFGGDVKPFAMAVQTMQETFK